ncbi:N-acetyltransferase [bacterium 1XD42-8]|jgi:GNAT superfamily N-acetyltransferase|nr:GNAT family N-acetyltransferase [Lachnospiraceae bacterium]RKJ47430.1 N-acetyltransferase [bacterium 1XD42-8]
MIKQIRDNEEKQAMVRGILERLPEWFGISKARENYILRSPLQMVFGAFNKEKNVGILCLEETGRDIVELYVMGVLKDYDRKGIGTELFKEAKAFAIFKGYSFIQVKTVQMGKYEEYDKTNHFYVSLGFKEFEVFPTLWDEWNPCQVYVMALEQ